MHNKKYQNISIKKSHSNRSVCQDVEKLRRESQQFIKKFQEFERQNYENFKKIKKKVPHQSEIASSLHEQIHHFRYNLNSRPDLSKSISRKQKKNKSRNSIDSKNFLGFENNRHENDAREQQFFKQSYKASVKNVVEVLFLEHEGQTYKNLNDILKKISSMSKKIIRLQNQAEQLKEVNKQVKGRRSRKESIRQKYQLKKVSNQELQELKEQILLLEKQNNNFKAEITILKMENDQIKAFRQNDSTQISELIQKLTKKQVELTNLSKQLHKQKEAKLNLEKKITQQKQKFTKQLSNERNQKNLLEQKVHAFEMQKMSFMESEIIEVDNFLDKEESQDFELKMRQQIQFLSVENERLKSENQKYKQKLSQKEFEYDQVMNRVSELEFKENTMKQSANQQALISKKIEEASLAKQIANYEKIQNIQKEISELSQQLKRKQISEKNTITSILNSLKDLKKNLPKIKKKDSEVNNKQIGSSLTQSINKQIRELKEIVEGQLMREEDIRNSMRDIFKIQVIEYEIKGYKQIFNEIKNEIEKKNRKISKQEENNLILEKDLKKAQMMIQSREKELKVEDMKRIRSLTPVRDKSVEKIKGIELAKFQKEIGEKKEIIEKLQRQIEANEGQVRAIKSGLQAQIQSLKSEIKMTRDLNTELKEEINIKSLEKQQQNQEIQRYKRKIKQLGLKSQELRNSLIRKQSQSRKQSIENVGKLKKQESKSEKLQSELTRERESRNEIQRYYESIIEDKKKVIDELFSKQSQLKQEIRMLNEKINQLLLQNSASSQKQQKQPKKLQVAHPQSMNISYKFEASKSISQLEKQLQKSQQKIIELELEKRKLNRLLSEIEEKSKGQEMLIEENNFSKMLQEEIRHERKIRQDLEIRIKLIEKERLNLEMKITEKEGQVEGLERTILQLNGKNEQNILKLKEDEKKERELIRIIENLKEQKDEEIEALQKQNADTSNKKDEQLAEYIEKYNNAKIELFEKLDCKSDEMQDIKIKYQNEIAHLKQYIELLEAKINNTMIKSQNNSREEQSKTIHIPSKLSSYEETNQIRYASSGEVSGITKKQQERENSTNLKVNQEDYQIEDQYYEPRFGEIDDQENLDEDEEPIDESQLADEVGELDFYSPLEARIVIEEEDADECQKEEGGFNLGLMEMMGDYNQNEQVIEPDD